MKTPHTLPLLFLVACVAALFFPYFSAGSIPINGVFLTSRFQPWNKVLAPARHNPEVDDPILCYLPLKLQAVRTMKQGELPLWNPSILCGTPLLEDGYSTPLNPLNLLYAFLPVLDAWSWLLMLQALAAGLGMYAFLGVYRLPVCSRLLGAVAYMLCTSFTVFMEWPNFLGCYAWLPLAMLATERLAAIEGDVDRPRVAALGGAVVGLQFVAGIAQLSVYFVVSVAVLMAVRLWQIRHEPAQLRRLVGYFSLMMGIGIGLGAIVWLPTAQILANAQRSPSRYLEWNRPMALWTYLWRDIFGNPVNRGFVPFTGWYMLAYSGYAGLWTLLLAVQGMLRLDRRRVPFLLLLIPLPLYLVASGSAQVVAALSFIPGFFGVDHLRAVGIYAFALATLAAFGLSDVDPAAPSCGKVFGITGGLTFFGLVAIVVTDLVVGMMGPNVSMPAGVQFLYTIHRQFGSILWSPYVLPVVALGVGYLAWAGTLFTRVVPVSWWSAGVVFVVTVDLLIGGIHWMPHSARSQVYPMTAATRWLAEHADSGRLLVADPRGTSRGRNGILPPNVGSVYGFREVRGYESLWVGWYRTLIGTEETDYFNSVPCPDRALVDLLGVRYLVGRDESYASPRWKLVYKGEVCIFENQHPAPRAFVVSQVEVKPLSEIRQLLLRDRWDVRRAVLIPPEDREMLPPSADEHPWQPARVVESLANRVTVETDTSWPGYLVLSDTWYPGWQARVDGVVVPIARAYGALRVVSLSAGPHRVEFVYRPPLVFAGAIVGGLSLLICLGLVFFPRKAFGRRDRNTATHSPASP